MVRTRRRSQLLDVTRYRRSVGAGPWQDGGSGNAAAPWKKDAECPVNLLGSQRIKPSWDWAESVYLGDATASFSSAYGRTADAIEQALAFGYRPGSTAVADARVPRLPADSADIVFTDPPITTPYRMRHYRTSSSYG